MISFVYFDVGGVVMLDFHKTNKWHELKHDLGVPDEKMAQFDSIWNRYPIAIDCDVDKLIYTIGQEIGFSVPDKYSMLEDFVRRFEPNSFIVPVIWEIQKTCRVGLLTNQYPRMFSLLQEKNLIPRVQWDIIIDSSVVKLKKPDSKIYALAQEKAGVPAYRILFVENQEENMKAALEAGWNAFLYDSADPEKSSQDLLEYFRNIH
jgi:FMN phosphatase YigB (HAD superfamily)